jgi:hypothetical protein
MKHHAERQVPTHPVQRADPLTTDGGSIVDETPAPQRKQRRDNGEDKKIKEWLVHGLLKSWAGCAGKTQA